MPGPVSVDWLRSKCAPTYKPTGPYLVPAACAPDPSEMTITLRLNGETMQHESTSDMIFDVAALVSYLSHEVQLLPGDRRDAPARRPATAPTTAAFCAMATSSRVRSLRCRACSATAASGAPRHDAARDRVRAARRWRRSRCTWGCSTTPSRSTSSGRARRSSSATACSPTTATSASRRSTTSSSGTRRGPTCGWSRRSSGRPCSTSSRRRASHRSPTCVARPWRSTRSTAASRSCSGRSCSITASRPATMSCCRPAASTSAAMPSSRAVRPQGCSAPRGAPERSRAGSFA